MSPILAVVLAALAILVSAVLALIETSFTRLGAVGAKALEETHPDRAKRLDPLLERPNRVLAPVLLLTLACHITAASLLAIVAADQFGAWGCKETSSVSVCCWPWPGYPPGCLRMVLRPSWPACCRIRGN